MNKAPILDLQWSLYSSILYTVSADQTLAMTDLTTGQRVRKIRAHRGIINALDRTMAGGAGVELVVTGSDDGTVKIWEGGEEGGKSAVGTFEIGCPVTSVCWSADGQNVYIGALDNEIHASRFLSDSKTVILHTYLPARYMTSAKMSKYTPSRDTQTPQRPCASRPTDLTSSPPPSPRTLSSTTSARSRPPQAGYTAFSKAPRQASKTRC